MCAEHSKVVKKMERKCGRCKNHGYETILKFHKNLCSYRNCICEMCQTLVVKQERNNSLVRDKAKEKLIKIEVKIEKKRRVRVKKAKEHEMILLRKALLKLKLNKKRRDKVSISLDPETTRFKLESFEKVFVKKRNQVPEVSSSSTKNGEY